MGLGTYQLLAVVSLKQRDLLRDILCDSVRRHGGTVHRDFTDVRRLLARRRWTHRGVAVAATGIHGNQGLDSRA
jgi:hypothetical protein